MIACQLSLYPLGTPAYTPVIKEALAVLEQCGVEIEVNAMGTIIRGEEEAVWRAARQLFQVAAGRGEAVLVMTVSNRCGCKVANKKAPARGS
ncbi:thiamine-binding protein [Neomoorella thermoacetica]|uniref:thiamine-binding protein n=1 Tax=Neomoorella thermoacetica TaxID=1525 RepID=UPI0008FAEEA4|nr:YkoF family thiamine/hydroxymethylpyrimidine-binding protein [Moorella thermoacetica]APC09442.1 YKOF-related family protein [Moorella thermoacetica]